MTLIALITPLVGSVLNMIIGAIIFSLIVVIIVYLAFKNKTKNLKESKLELERIVEERTAELRHKEQEVMDSIRYALRIQLSIIPTEIKVRSLLPQCAVFYKPKDIVSGD